MKKEDFSYSFESLKQVHEISGLLLNVAQWWSGLYEEIIKGKSGKVGDEFTFEAGKGVHYSKQKLVGLIPDKKITWEVIDSDLSFLKRKNEWNGTRFGFDLIDTGAKVRVTFTHQGLAPAVECYDQCSQAWTLYLQNLKKKLNDS